MIDPSWIRLAHLISPVLPVGAYTYSQGLEWAVEQKLVQDEVSAQAWIGDCLDFGCAHFEAVYLAHLMRAWQQNDTALALQWNEEWIASRESAELRAETLQMGQSLRRLLLDLHCFAVDPLQQIEQCSYPFCWSYAAVHWGIALAPAVTGYVWAWLENQVMAAVRLVPLGQTSGQSLLLSLGSRLAQCTHRALETPLTQATSYLPALAIASCCHETQYTRLFRS